MIRDILRNTTAAEWAGDVAGVLSGAAIIVMALFFAPELQELIQ